jgi:hypothetical protein
MASSIETWLAPYFANRTADSFAPIALKASRMALMSVAS